MFDAVKLFEGEKVKLSYLDYGSALAPPLLMFHGGAWCWQEFLSLIPSLAQEWHVYSVDLRGNGSSGWVPGQYRLQDFEQDNSEFLSQLKAPAVLVGHSIGGVVALMMAHHPERVKAVIVEDSPLTLENYRRIIDQSREMFALWLGLKKTAKSEVELSVALADAYKNYPGITSAWLLFFAGCLWRLDPTFFSMLLDDFDSFTAGYDYREILSKIQCPVLFLRGEVKLGAVMSDDEVAWLRRNCSNARCAFVDGVGHLLHLQDQGQAPVLREMMAFLDML